MVARAVTHAWRTHPRFRHLFDELAEPVLVADEDSRYVDANAAACSLLGYTMEELLKLGVADIVASSAEWTAEEYARYLREGHWHGPVRLRRKNGEVVSAVADARILSLATGQRAYISVLRV